MPDRGVERLIYYHHTDAGGVVYYGTYLALLEEGRTDYCLGRGVDTRLLLQEGIAFVVVHAAIDYAAPARYGDTVRIRTRVTRIGTSSIHFAQEILNGETLAVKAEIVWATVRLPQMQSIPVPDAVRVALTDEGRGGRAA